MKQQKSHSPVTAVILAAGRGTRMKSRLPKVMHPVGAMPMVAHSVQLALDVGCAPIAVVVAPGMDNVADAARAIGGDLDMAIQREQLGTGHAVLAARPALGEVEGHLLVLYGDTPLLTPATVERLLAALREEPRCAVAVLGFVAEDPAAYGRLLLSEDGHLERIVEAKDASDDELAIDFCNSGVMALRGDVAWTLLAAIDNKNAKNEFYLTDVVAIARAAGYTATAVEADADEVLGVNSRNELAVAEAIFQFRARQKHMEAGVTLLDPDSVYFAADTRIAPDVVIEPHVVFGRGVSIGSGAHIKAFSHIDGATIGEQAVVGPFARLRPGTVLGENARIGNFVEVKNSTIAAQAKINHLSYVGDSSVGEHANIGAGTITCNYDGHHKYRTTIGAHVFVGSHSTLIAPVKIDDGAFVAAGSVITRDVTPGALAIARTPQTEKPGWAKAFHAKSQ